jgi:predicted deacetylase
MSRLKLLLSLHDVTPSHAARIARAEALFCELGVAHVTYLLVPRYHGQCAVERDACFRAWCHRQRPFTVRWCLHGYRHEEARRAERFSLQRWFDRRFLTAGEGEFLNPPDADAKKWLDRGSLAYQACIGASPVGFVALAWLFNDALIPALRERQFSWTEDRRRIYDLQRRRSIDAPVITWSSRTIARRYGSTMLAPLLLRRWRDRPVLRIAVHPLDFDDRQLVASIRALVATALSHRVAEGYDELLASQPGS